MSFWINEEFYSLEKETKKGVELHGKLIDLIDYESIK